MVRQRDRPRPRPVRRRSRPGDSCRDRRGRQPRPGRPLDSWRVRQGGRRQRRTQHGGQGDHQDHPIQRSRGQDPHAQSHPGQGRLPEATRSAAQPPLSSTSPDTRRTWSVLLDGISPGLTSILPAMTLFYADTLIVWTEPNGTDIALSFADPNDCENVWEFILEVQKMLDSSEFNKPSLSRSCAAFDAFCSARVGRGLMSPFRSRCRHGGGHLCHILTSAWDALSLPCARAGRSPTSNAAPAECRQARVSAPCRQR